MEGVEGDEWKGLRDTSGRGRGRRVEGVEGDEWKGLRERSKDSTVTQISSNNGGQATHLVEYVGYARPAVEL